jgi:aminocarboxymuconate-semialdehyde decarboxylase
VIHDVHAHVVPPALTDAIDRDGPSLGVEFVAENGRRAIAVGGRSRGALNDDLVDVEARLAAMDRARVDVQLLSSWVGLTAYTLPPAQGVRWSRVFNEALAELVASHPTRFRGLCHVPLQAPEPAAAELQHAVGTMGMVGVEITTTVDGAELDDDRLEPFWAAAGELGCLVLVHPDRALPGRTKPRHFLANTVGNAAETTVAAVSLVCGGVLERHPGLRVCVVHGGGYLPYQVGRLDHAYAAVPKRAGGALPHPPSTYLRRLYYDTVTHSPEVLRFLIDFAGADHVVLGSDYPFEMGDADPVQTIERVPSLTADERRQILGGNVEHLLRAVTADR